ncbi:MAG: hypothetical protein ACRD3Q_10885 [Terriglobales bacterium]
MTIELRHSHGYFFFALAVAQSFGLWLSLARSGHEAAVLEFFTRGGWFGLVIPLAWVIGSAFTTTVLLAKLTQGLTKRG